MTGVLWAAATAALLISLASLALSALVTSRYRELHAAIVARSAAPAYAGGPGPTLPAVGTPVPQFSAVTTDGTEVGTDAVSQQGSVAVFLDTMCSTCKNQLPEISGFLAERAAAGPPPLAVVNGQPEQLREYLDAFPEGVLAVGESSGELARAFGVQAFPTVLVFNDGKVSASGFRPAELTAAAR